MLRCTECGRSCASKQSLAYHTVRSHKTEIKSIEKLTQSNETHTQLNQNDQPYSKLHEQFIADNFDMSCDQCDAKFTKFYEAREHYKDAHNENNGYIKCCGKKLNKLSLIRDHINTHLCSATIKYVSRLKRIFYLNDKIKLIT